MAALSGYIATRAIPVATRRKGAFVFQSPTGTLCLAMVSPHGAKGKRDRSMFRATLRPQTIGNQPPRPVNGCKYSNPLPIGRRPCGPAGVRGDVLCSDGGGRRQIVGCAQLADHPAMFARSLVRRQRPHDTDLQFDLPGKI